MFAVLMFVLGAAAQGVEAQEFIAQDAGFAVVFPGTPTRTERTRESSDGPSRSISYQVNHNGCGYLAQRIDFPAGVTAAKMLEKQRDSLHKKNEQAGGVDVSEAPVSLGLHPGIEVVQE